MMGRFSDAELEAMRQQLDGHVAEFRAHIAEEDKRWESILELQERNAEQIERLTKSTEGMVDAWQVATGGMRLFVILGQFAKWLAGFAVFVAIAQWFGWIGGHK